MPSVTWDHIHLRTRDAEACAQWFSDMLGAEVLRKPEGGKTRIDLVLGGQKIFLLPVGEGDAVNPTPVRPHLGLDHFGVAVTEIDAFAAELKRKGVEFVREPHTLRPGLRICFIKGPDGIAIELLERDAKYT